MVSLERMGHHIGILNFLQLARVGRMFFKFCVKFGYGRRELVNIIHSVDNILVQVSRFLVAG